MNKYQAIANGGPLNGVKITAEASWDGLIRKPCQYQKVFHFHQGRYHFDFMNWEWRWYPQTVSAVGHGEPRRT